MNSRVLVGSARFFHMCEYSKTMIAEMSVVWFCVQYDLKFPQRLVSMFSLCFLMTYPSEYSSKMRIRLICLFAASSSSWILSFLPLRNNQFVLYKPQPSKLLASPFVPLDQLSVYPVWMGCPAFFQL